MNMITLERKNEIARIILATEDEELINKIFDYTKNLLKTSPPCQYTLDEIVERADQQVLDYKAGKLKTIPHEDLMKKYAP